MTRRTEPKRQRKCPLCGHPVEEEFRPFCSKRCKQLDLGRWLDSGRPLAIRAFLEATGYREVAIEPAPGAPGGDPFFNVNTPDDLARAAAFLSKETDQ